MTDTVKTWIEERRAIHRDRHVKSSAWSEATKDWATELPRALNALSKVLEEHKPMPNSCSALFPTPLCTCGKNYPCPTVQAIEEAING